MTTITNLNDKLAFSPQILPEQVAELAEQGFEQIICNRPDAEDFDQPNIEEIETLAAQHGINVVYAPIANNQFYDEEIEESQSALGLDKKTLMFCRSGTRSSVLWAIVQTRQGKPLSETLDTLKAIGYDIRHMQDSINAMAKSH